MNKIKTFFLNLVHQKFQLEVLINLSSNILIGATGVLINTIIGKFYGLSFLGVFNQSLSIYLLLGTFATFGVRNAVLKYSAEESQDTLNKILSSALKIIIPSSFILTIGIFFLTKQFQSIFFNKSVTEAFIFFLIGIPFFAFSKTVIAQLNALRKIKELSFIQNLRVVIILIFIIVIITCDIQKSAIFFSFAFSEICCSFVLGFYLIKNLKFVYQPSKYWVNKNLIFGLKSFLLEFFGQTNTYLDIFIISFFLSNHDVGQYSLVISIMNGLLMLTNSVQLNFNPFISNMWKQNKKDELQELIFKITKKMWRISSLIFITIALMFPIYILLFFSTEDYVIIISTFYITLFGFFFPSIYYFAGAIFTLSNFVGFSIVLSVVQILLNSLLAIIFIPKFGIIGAAISTSLFHIFSVLITIYGMRYKMNLRFHEDVFFSLK